MSGRGGVEKKAPVPSEITCLIISGNIPNFIEFTNNL